jgi:hypothetical protein
VVALVTVAVAYPVLWVLARPGGQPLGRFLGELCGAEAVLPFFRSLVLATLLAPIERAFGGLDRVAVWHRRAAVAGVVLLIPHVALVSSTPDRYATSLGHALGDIGLIGLLVLAVWALAPSLRGARWPRPIERMARATYERWLIGHRLTGLFVADVVGTQERVNREATPHELARVVDRRRRRYRLARRTSRPREVDDEPKDAVGARVRAGAQVGISIHVSELGVDRVGDVLRDGRQPLGVLSEPQDEPSHPLLRSHRGEPVTPTPPAP